MQTNLLPTCIEYTDTYYNTVTGEVLWVEVYTVCSGGDGPGGGGGGGGTGPGGDGPGPTQCRGCGYTPPPPAPTTYPPVTTVYGECIGLKQALATQNAEHKEVVGYVAKDGTVISFSTLASISSDHDFSLSFGIYDSQARLLTARPYLYNGVWKIDVNNWINGTYGVDTYTIDYFFHTHPIGPGYNSNVPSSADLNNAGNWLGMSQHIITDNTEVVYNSSGVISASNLHCP